MRKKIGIITGSGPEAGIDLWGKILDENKAYLKNSFQGDLDAPNVTIFSRPELGHSMELEKNYDSVWKTLKKAIQEIVTHVDYFVIACNTLNVYEKEIESIGLKHQFLSTLDVVENYIKEKQLNNIAIIAALPVLQMGKYSAFHTLNKHFNIEVPHDFAKVHQLIYDIKQYGGEQRDIIDAFESIIDDIESNHIFLACTELPLVTVNCKEKNLIDVTQLLAKQLVEKSFEQ
jgi:aspartate racemase